MFSLFHPKAKQAKELLPPSLRQTYGNKHTTLATDGYIWITNTGIQALHRIDTTTLEVVEFPTGGATPAGITFDGTYLYVSHFNSNTISKMTTSGAVIDTFTVGSGLHQIGFDGTDLWVTSYWSGEVIKLSTSGTILATYTSGRFPVDLVVASGKVWVGLFNFTTSAQGTGALLKLNLDGTLNAEYVVGDNPLGIDFDGTYIWTEDFLNGNFYKVNKDTGAIAATFNTGIEGAANLHLSYSEYGNYILVTISKDYSPYDLPNNLNIVQIRSASTGALVETVNVGIDPRNVSVDEFHYGYVAGYGDGSVTRFLLNPPPPFPPTTNPIPALLLTPPSPLNLATGEAPIAATNITINPTYFSITNTFSWTFPPIPPLTGQHGFHFFCDITFINPVTDPESYAHAGRPLIMLMSEFGIGVNAQGFILYSWSYGSFEVPFTWEINTRYKIDIFNTSTGLSYYVNSNLISTTASLLININSHTMGVSIGSWGWGASPIPDSILYGMLLENVDW